MEWESRDKAAALVKRFGVAPIINAGGPNTLHAGSRPRDEVLAAMVEAAGLFFRMDELVIRAGEMIAAAVGAEAATVTAGAGSGLTLQSAAAITRGDPGEDRPPAGHARDGQRTHHPAPPSLRLRPPVPDSRRSVCRGGRCGRVCPG